MPSCAIKNKMAAGAVEDENLAHKLWIGNLDKRLSEFHVLKVLQQYGKVKNFEFLFHKTGPNKGEARGYCFVEYTSKEEAQKACKSLNGKMALSKTLKVDWAREHIITDEVKSSTSQFKKSCSYSTGSESQERKIKAIEDKLKLMDKNEQVLSFQGKHPLLAESEKNKLLREKERAHPYKYNRRLPSKKGRR